MSWWKLIGMYRMMFIRTYKMWSSRVQPQYRRRISLTEIYFRSIHYLGFLVWQNGYYLATMKDYREEVKRIAGIQSSREINTSTPESEWSKARLNIYSNLGLMSWSANFNFTEQSISLRIYKIYSSWLGPRV